LVLVLLLISSQDSGWGVGGVGGRRRGEAMRRKRGVYSFMRERIVTINYNISSHRKVFSSLSLSP